MHGCIRLQYNNLLCSSLQHAVCIIEKQTKPDREYLVVQRPDTGKLLHSLYQHPTFLPVVFELG